MLTGKLIGDADPKSQGINMPQYHDRANNEMDRKLMLCLQDAISLTGLDEIRICIKLFKHFGG